MTRPLLYWCLDNSKDFVVTRFEIIQPEKELKAFVRYCWVLVGEASSEEPYHHRMLPTGCAEMLIIKKGRFHHWERPQGLFEAPNAVVFGQLNKSQEFVLDQPFQILGICLYPYSMTAFSGMSADQLINQVLPLSDLPVMDFEVDERLANGADLTAWTASISKLIEETNRVLSPAKRKLFELIKSLVNEPGPSIGALADKYGIPMRTLQRACKKYTGYSPKALFRISRIQKVLEGGEVKSMTELAHELEYYDQAHFINDFKRITSQSPTHFFEHTPEGLAWYDKGEMRE